MQDTRNAAVLQHEMPRTDVLMECGCLADQVDREGAPFCSEHCDPEKFPYFEIGFAKGQIRADDFKQVCYFTTRARQLDYQVLQDSNRLTAIEYNLRGIEGSTLSRIVADWAQSGKNRSNDDERKAEVATRLAGDETYQQLGAEAGHIRDRVAKAKIELAYCREMAQNYRAAMRERGGNVD